MIAAIVGSRSFKNYQYLEDVLSLYDNITHIISGGATGVDSLVEKYARKNKINMTVFKPLWTSGDKSGGIQRNKLMVKCCDYVIAFWDGKSKGTKFTIEEARRNNTSLFTHKVGESNGTKKRRVQRRVG